MPTLVAVLDHEQLIVVAGQDGAEVRVFLMGDAVTCVLAGCCGNCLDAREIADDRIAEGARRSSLDELNRLDGLG